MRWMIADDGVGCFFISFPVASLCAFSILFSSLQMDGRTDEVLVEWKRIGRL